MKTFSLFLFIFSVNGYSAPEDCDYSKNNELNQISLYCRLSAINSPEEATNFSAIPSDQRISQLSVLCTHPNDQSSLEDSGFSSLGFSLKSLSIEECHLSFIPPKAFLGLNKLKSLRIRSIAKILSFSETMENLLSLNNLDLRENGIYRLSHQFLCSYPQLETLQISNNRLSGTLEDLNPLCSHIRYLNASGNQITHLSKMSPSWTFLDLNSNFIRFIEKEALPQSNNLQILNLANNQIMEFPSQFFQHGRNITKLNLSNNSLSELSVDLFDGLKNLNYLDISGNILTTLSSLHFKHLSLLTILYLNNNRLVELSDTNIWLKLPSLSYLKLNGNHLESLTMNITSVIELDLRENRLETLNLFLQNVTHVYLSDNRIKSLADEIFTNCSRLLLLDLSRNKFTTLPSSIEHLSDLQTLDLSYNNVILIESASFLQNTNLWRLQLSGNNLQNISLPLFSKLKSLQILDLSFNNITNVEKGSFDSNQHLKALRLDGNSLINIDGLFLHLNNLSWLNISDNFISTFDYSMVGINLHWLDISHNKISELGNYLDLTNETKLNYLDASFNLLHQLGPHNIPDSISILNVNDNNISTLVPYTFFKKTYLSQVDLRVNALHSIDKNALRLSNDDSYFYLGGNPIICDCNMMWFKSINDQRHYYPIVHDIESIYCRLAPHNAFMSLVDVRNNEFLCSYTAHCFALCHCCDFDACDCEMTCSENCSCYHDLSWSQNIASCSSAGFTKFPKQLPIDATELFLDGNNLGHLIPNDFLGRKNLQILHLNHSQIQSIYYSTFHGLHSLNILHLEHNQLSFLEGREFANLTSIKELYLNDNVIETIANGTFESLISLSILHLQGNLLATLNEFPSLNIRLGGNPWSCHNCVFMQKFQLYLLAKVSDKHNVYCYNGTTNSAISFDISSCLSNREALSSQPLITRKYLPLLAGLLAVLALLLLILLIIYIFRTRIRLWLYSRYSIRIFDTQNSKSSKPFDVFITYSVKDSHFVLSELARELEMQYKVCLHFRDLPSQTHVVDTFLEATESSERTLFVLSREFLKTEWRRYDYKSGFHQALRKHCRKKLLIVILGTVPSRSLDPDLRLYLKNCNIVKWGEKYFWEKIKYFLPDVSKINHSDSVINMNIPGPQI